MLGQPAAAMQSILLLVVYTKSCLVIMEYNIVIYPFIIHYMCISIYMLSQLVESYT